MTLNDLQARNILESPRHKKQIKAVKNLESALRVFTEEMDRNELKVESYWSNFCRTMSKRLGEKKADRVMDFARFPLPISQVTDSILSDYYKVFDGKNRYFNIEGDRDLTRLKEWVKDVNIEKWIEENAKGVFKNKPCSFVIIDRDSNGVPYPILIDSNRLIDAQHNEEDDTKLEYISFVHSVEMHETDVDVKVIRYAVYDDESFYVFRRDSNQSDYVLESNNKHNVGYCPAMPFVCEPTNSKNKFKRRVAFGPSLSKLEDWTYFDIFRNYVDHYAPFPVTESIKPKCSNPECENGFIVSQETILEGDQKGETETKYKECSTCDGGKDVQFVGPGTHIGLEFYVDPTMNDGSNKFKMIFPETDKLKYTPDKLDDLELEITLKTIGVNSNQSNEAFNEMQVKGSFSSMDTVLLRTKTVLDKVYKFMVEVAGKMFYKNLNIDIDANHGTEWYLISEEDLQKRLKEAKAIGLPINEINSIYRQIVETKYANNKSKRDREDILIDLQEFPFYSIEEVIKLKNESVADDFQLSLKANFLTFIKRFERENGPVTMFGENLDYDAKIKAIKEELEKYNLEVIAIKAGRVNVEVIDNE